MLNAATQTFLGDRSADLVAGYDANLLGTAGSVAFGLSGLDFYKDLSDIAHGLENWENTPGDYLNLGVNLIALLPVIGAFKNLGKPATDAASHVAKQIDDEVANLRAIGANNRSAPDFHNNISQRQPGGYLRASKGVDLLSPKAKKHILYGDGPGIGGHLWPGQVGKTPFPKSWDADKIVHEVSDIITDPKVKWYAQTGSGGPFTMSGKPARWVSWEVKDGVRIRTVYEPATGEVITAFPDPSTTIKGIPIP